MRLPIFLLIISLGCFFSSSVWLWAQEEILPEPYEKGIPLEVLPEIRKLFQEANDFPKANAKTACKRLMQYGDVIIPSIDYYLKKGSWRQKVAMAYIGDELHSKALFQGLSLAAKDPEVSSYLKYFFEALLHSDFIPAQEVILAYLKHPKNSVRWLAMRTLEPILHPDLESTLLQYLASKEVSSKENVLALLGVYRNTKLIPQFLEFLGHESQAVAYQAAQELSKFNTEELVRTLISNLNHADFRIKGYSLLTMILLQDRYKVQFFDADLFKLFLRDLRSPQEFTRYTSAIALACINEADVELELSIQDETNLLNNLIQSCMGNKYFKDYQSVRTLGLEKLQKVTGKNFSADPVKWKTWWDNNQGVFRILKRLKDVPPMFTDQVRIFYETEGNEPKSFLFSVQALESLTTQYPLSKIRILASSDMLQLMHRFKENGFFEMKSNYGVAESEIGWLRTIKVAVDTQERSVTVRTGFHHQEFETLETLIEDLIKKHNWQAYWSKGFGGGWHDWWYNNYYWFQVASDYLEIQNRLKTLIIENLEYSLRRENDLQDLKNLILEMKNSSEINKETFEPLTIWELSQLVEFIVKQPQITNTTDFLLECICLSQNDKILEPLFGYFLKQEIYGPKARTYLSQLIENFGRNAVLRYLVDSDWRLRSSAAEVAWKEAFANDLEIQALLRKRLSSSGSGIETNVSVRQSLIYAIGLTGKAQKEDSDRMEELYVKLLRKLQKRPKVDESVIADIDYFTKLMMFRYENMNPDEQQKLVTILKSLFGEQNVTSSQYTISIAPTSNLSFKVEDLQELKQVIDITKNWDVTLLEEQLKENNATLTRSTLAALGNIGTERSLGIITEYLAHSDPSYRAEAVKALGSTKKSKFLISVINGLLRDTSQRVNQIASQSLIEWGTPEVQDVLLRELNSSKNPSLRLRIIDTLGQFAKQDLLKELKPYLEDEDSLIRISTAALFANFGEYSIIPLLVESIGKGNDYLVLQSLSMLTCQNFKGSSEQIAIRYKHWWEENRLLGQRQWYFNALREQGYPVDELLEYTAGNDQDKRGVPVLLKALKDQNWYIRYNASLALENISGLKNNRMYQQTSVEEREKQILNWYQWWEKQSE